MGLLGDGTYEGLCVDAEEAGDASAGVTLSITIVAGAHKGEVVDVRATGLAGDPLDLMGMPCTVTVADGQPTVSFS